MHRELHAEPRHRADDWQSQESPPRDLPLAVSTRQIHHGKSVWELPDILNVHYLWWFSFMVIFPNHSTSLMWYITTLSFQNVHRYHCAEFCIHLHILEKKFDSTTKASGTILARVQNLTQFLSNCKGCDLSI